MGKINCKKYYTSEEIDIKIKESILRNAKELASEIKKSKLESKVEEYV
ncbi:MAG: hypothetical protein PHI37_00655 [Candidatus Gracilibacteria bacterium]|nr:hypothetical protein [Candidatus Gracilibacteria bacterium]